MGQCEVRNVNRIHVVAAQGATQKKPSWVSLALAREITKPRTLAKRVSVGQLGESTVLFDSIDWSARIQRTTGLGFAFTPRA
jgi:hypothetical protein